MKASRDPLRLGLECWLQISQTLSGEFSPLGALSLVGYVSATDFCSDILLTEYSLRAIFEHDLGS